MASASSAGAATPELTPSVASRLRSVWSVPRGELGRAGALSYGGTVSVGGFTLPQGTRQGAPLWYAIHLSGLVHLKPGHSECELSAATDGATAAQFVIRTQGHRTLISTNGWIQGGSDRMIKSPVYRVNFWNYLQTSGVHGGVNSLTLSVQDLGAPCIRGVRLFKGTGVAVTKADPRELQLLAPRGTLSGTKGQALTIPFEVTRRGGWPDHGATVVLTLPAGWRSLNGTRRTLSRIGSRRAGSFRVVAGTLGSQQLMLAVAGSYNQPIAPVRVTVHAPPAWFSTLGRVPILVSAAFIVLAAALTRAGWRDRRREKQQPRPSRVLR
jgi:hypothetical protein